MSKGRSVSTGTRSGVELIVLEKKELTESIDTKLELISRLVIVKTSLQRFTDLRGVHLPVHHFQLLERIYRFTWSASPGSSFSIVGTQTLSLSHV